MDELGTGDAFAWLQAGSAALTRRGSKVRLLRDLCLRLSLSLICASMLTGCAAASAFASEERNARPVVTIGLVDVFTPRFFMYSFTPLVETLRERLPQYRFEVRELPPGAAFAREVFPKNTFLVLSVGDAVRFPELGIREIATRRPKDALAADRAVGALFVVRRDSPLKSLSDLEGRRIAATSPDAFGGWLIPRGEAARLGFDPDRFFGGAVFTEWHVPDVPMQVLSGQADAGILETCALEEAEASGAVPRGALRSLHVLGTSPCLRSTELYPEVMITSLPAADPDIVRDVTIEVLRMPRDENGCDWVPNNNHGSVLNLMRDLQEGPYAYLKDYSPTGIWRRFSGEILAAAGALALLLIHVVRVNLLVRRRTQELLREEEKRAEAAEALRESRQRISALERAGIAAGLGTLFAHEVKQPITNIVNYLTGVLMLERRGSSDSALREKTHRALERAVEEAYRAAEIIERVRSSVKRERPQRSPVNLAAAVQAGVVHAGFRKHPEIRLTMSLPDEPVMVLGDALELELLVLNLLKNAAEALESAGKAVPDPEVTVTLAVRLKDRIAELAVADNGPQLSDAAFGRLSQLSSSEKTEGLGFGLMIVRAIAESHLGHIAFERREQGGLRVRVEIPLLAAGNKGEAS